MKFLTAVPIYNEERHLDSVLAEIRRYSPNILVVNDGSTDRSGELLTAHSDLTVITHGTNLGYGAALRSAFCHAVQSDFDVLVTVDCDAPYWFARVFPSIPATAHIRAFARATIGYATTTGVSPTGPGNLVSRLVS